MKLNARSLKNLSGVHPDLRKVVDQVCKTIADDALVQFIVTEGLRTLVRQQELFRAKATRTMNSRHLTGHAFDIAITVNGEVRWDWPLYQDMSVIIKEAAKQVGVDLVWGGDWTTFRDGPHYELNRRSYA